MSSGVRTVPQPVRTAAWWADLFARPVPFDGGLFIEFEDGDWQVAQTGRFMPLVYCRTQAGAEAAMARIEAWAREGRHALARPASTEARWL